MRRILCVIFGSRHKRIRTRRVKGQIVCVVQDVCSMLGMSKSNTTNLIKQLDDTMKCKVHVQSGVRKMLCINKAGLYAVMLHGKKQEAVIFRQWVCTKVLAKMKISRKMYQSSEQVDEYYGKQAVNW
ncbi:Bro-N domain-containing protein [Geobacter sp. AOG1]|uniref:BRO-N domain-containing protein n=1 Tax=Geobacter sp. AOG1 TaxID=1566346 RepID=UPI001CC37FA0